VGKNIVTSKMALEIYEVGVKVGMNFTCPKCTSKNVVIEYNTGGYYHFYRCNECGFKVEEEVSF